jgi:hypothetical protein
MAGAAAEVGRLRGLGLGDLAGEDGDDAGASVVRKTAFRTITTNSRGV